MIKFISFLLVLITFINSNLIFFYANDIYDYDNNDYEVDYIDDLIIMGNWGNDFGLDLDMDYNPNFEFEYDFELEQYSDINTHAAITATAAYSAYLASKFIASAGVTLGVGAGAVAGTHFLSSVASDTAYVFTRMATDIYQTTGEFITGVNVNVRDFMSEAEFGNVMSSVRDVFNPSRNEFYPVGDGLAYGNLPIESMAIRFSQVGISGSVPAHFTVPYNSAYGSALTRASLGKRVVPSGNLQAIGTTNPFTITQISNSLPGYFRIRTGSGLQYSAMAHDAFYVLLGPLASGNYNLAGVFLVDHQVMGRAYDVRIRIGSNNHLTVGTFTFGNTYATDGFRFGYTDQLLNPSWDWGTTNVGTGTIDRPLVLHPPGTVDLGIDNVTVANPDFPWVIPDVGIGNPDIPLDPPVNPPVNPDLSWLDRVMSGFDSVVGATTAGATSVVGAVNTGVTSLTNTLTTGFTGTIGAINTGVNSITSSLSNLFSWFTAPPTVALDFSPLYISLSDVFPFSLPFDLYNLIRQFNATPEVPKFYIDFNEGLEGSASFVIDFEPFTGIALIVRYFVLAFFILGLIKLTNSLIGRSG